MRIITCAGYYATGSSAITDYISEFENCKSLTNYEFRFLQDPNGISDLEYNLVENHHRHNSGYALKNYKKMVDFLAGGKFNKRYERLFNGDWKKISYKYIEALTEFTYKGYWDYDVKDEGKLKYIKNRLVNKFLEKVFWRNNAERHYNELPKEITYCSYPTEEEFLNKTRAYVEELFTAVNVENKANVMVDQIVPASNIDRYLRYFNDVKVFVVERDPRDLYLLARYKWKLTVLPTDLETFCKWYAFTRRHRKTEKYNEEKVRFLYFEDLIYKYEDTTSKIKEFLGFEESEHVNPKKYFNPEISINGTRLWEKALGKGHEKEIEYIENNLKEYLYSY